MPISVFLNLHLKKLRKIKLEKLPAASQKKVF